MAVSLSSQCFCPPGTSHTLIFRLSSHVIIREKDVLQTAVEGAGMTQKRKIIVHIATTADGYIARPDGNLDWLTSRPAPKGFYGLPKFAQSIDAKILGRTTFDLSVKMGASFSPDDVHYVFSRRPAPASIPAGVHFVKEPISAFAERLRKQ